MVALGCSVVLIWGCAKSQAPVIEELISTGAPTFGGSSQRSYTAPSRTFTLSGECDPISLGIEASIDSGSWRRVANDCLSGTFSFSVSLSSTRSVRVRAKTRFGSTAHATAEIAYIVPPSSPTLTFVSGGRVNQENSRGMQASLSSSHSGVPTQNGLVTLHLLPPGMTYGE